MHLPTCGTFQMSTERSNISTEWHCIQVDVQGHKKLADSLEKMVEPEWLPRLCYSSSGQWGLLIRDPCWTYRIELSGAVARGDNAYNCDACNTKAERRKGIQPLSYLQNFQSIIFPSDFENSNVFLSAHLPVNHSLAETFAFNKWLKLL